MKNRIRLHPLLIHIMRISFLQSVLAFLTMTFAYSHSGHSQDLLDRSVTIQLENTQVSKVLARIEQQANVRFVYSSNTIGAGRKVSVNAVNLRLSEVLTLTLKPLNISYKIVGGQIMLQNQPAETTPAPVQPEEVKSTERKVSGKVSDSKGAPLPGVSIVVKGTQQGTSSDADGAFSVVVADDNASLIFSFVGYISQEVAVGTQSTIDIALIEDEKSLDELVVVGYGKQSTRQLSSSVSTVSGKDFADLPVSQFSQKLQGKLAGVQISQTTGTPGAGMAIRIRGAASITAGADPLYVVDGNPIVGGIANINPNEIESISVLKDASATALYGSRAANGVVLIETKKAVPGKTRIDYSTYIGAQQVPQRGRPDMMNAQEFATWRKEMAEERGLPVDPVFQNPQQYGEGTDWYDAITRTALMQDHSLSLSTGTENFSTTATAGFLQQDGVILGSGYKRYSLRVNTNFRPHEKLNIGINIAPTYTTDSNTGVDGVGSIVNETLQTSPLEPLRNPDGSLTLTATSPGMFPTPNYARTLTDRVVDNSETRILANLFAEYQITKALSFKTSANIDKGDGRSFAFNGLTTGARGTGLYKVPFSSLNQSKYLSWVNENILTFQKNFGEHNFDAIGGFTAQRFRQDASAINGNNYPDDKVKTLAAAGTVTANSSIQEWSLLSYLARVNYNYKGKYLLSASIRRDGSSRFGTRNRWGNFPSVSAGWILSEETFMSDIQTISFLKLRASWGVAGNFNIGNYTHIPTISTANYVFGKTVAGGRRVDNLADQGIGWESNEQFNIGLDLNLFKDRINFTYNYYRKNTSDLLFNVRVPRASGFGNIQTNIGELRFWGHEFSLNTVNVQKSALRWTTDFNISFDRNKVTSMGTKTNELITGSGSGLIGGDHITRVGYPIGMLYGMQHEGVYKNQQEYDNSPKHSTSQVGTAKFRDVNGDGIITVDDATIIGNPHPDFIFGMTNNVSYKNFDFSLTVSGTYGNDVVRGAEQTLTNLDGVFNVLANVKDRWRSPENPGSGRYGSLEAGTTYLERDWWGSQMMYDASHISINNITLGYTIPLKSNAAIKRLRAYASIQQAHIFTKYPGANPQVSLSQSTTGLGIDGGSYPVPRTYSLGFNVGF
ncbi:TonB-dependent receptor P3 [Dyadobacter sp. CECT 9623]|uniref:TonB-dependent receptor P3 n=2 Tax=Dyadobacter linearis TaxID=2823330 RepID=A0ABM8UW33_9BACT|nr:TonB-dependent receptor P3 [Dyadobacter sp. CECT 9623]